MNGPMCCGFPARLNNISPRLQFYVCQECRKEVLDLPPVELEEVERLFKDGEQDIFAEWPII